MNITVKDLYIGILGRNHSVKDMRICAENIEFFPMLGSVWLNADHIDNYIPVQDYINKCMKDCNE